MGKFKKQTCCFTGHRNIPPGEQTKILTRVRHRLIPLIQSGIIYYGVGGALGFDTLVAEMLIELKKKTAACASSRCFLLKATATDGLQNSSSMLRT